LQTHTPTGRSRTWVVNPCIELTAARKGWSHTHSVSMEGLSCISFRKTNNNNSLIQRTRKLQYDLKCYMTSFGMNLRVNLIVCPGSMDRLKSLDCFLTCNPSIESVLSSFSLKSGGSFCSALGRTFYPCSSSFCSSSSSSACTECRMESSDSPF